MDLTLCCNATRTFSAGYKVEAILLGLDALLFILLLLAVRRCEGSSGKPDLGLFSYIEDNTPEPSSRKGPPHA